MPDGAPSLPPKRRDVNLRVATATAPLGLWPPRRATAEGHGPMSHESRRGQRTASLDPAVFDNAAALERTSGAGR